MVLTPFPQSRRCAVYTEPKVSLKALFWLFFGWRLWTKTVLYLDTGSNQWVYVTDTAVSKDNPWLDEIASPDNVRDDELQVKGSPPPQPPVYV